MSKICYVSKRFRAESEETIHKAEALCLLYQERGVTLTLRQLYYQFVARGWIANKDSEYKRLGSIINDARLAGRIDWDHLQDRTRNLVSLAHWENPAHIIEAVAHQYRTDRWATQKYRPQVWIEKDAAIGTVEGICVELDVPFFSCRGYTSQSEMWASAQRLSQYYLDHEQIPVILHIGDHDPSGIDMSRDIQDRLTLFGAHFEFRRLALNMNQVEEYQPPPNPTKLTDARSTGYLQEFGDESWELDALDPAVVTQLISEAVYEVRDLDAWIAATEEQDQQKEQLATLSRRWEEAIQFIGA